MFPSLVGTPLDADNVRRRYVQPVVQEIGAPGASFHTFRHTCASLLSREARTPLQVQRWLGHHSAASRASAATSTCCQGDLARGPSAGRRVAGLGWQRSGNRKPRNPPATGLAAASVDAPSVLAILDATKRAGKPRRPHNPKVAGSNPAPAMIEKPCYAGLFIILGSVWLGAPWFRVAYNVVADLAGVGVTVGPTSCS